MQVDFEEKFDTHKSHQDHFREQDDFEIRDQNEPYRTPTKTNKFVYSYHGILSATE